MSLVTWIAVIKYLIYLLYLYVDDSFSTQKRGERLFYKHYQKELPSNLTRLLQLWDFIGLLHEERKQVFGDVLPIIGFEVNPNLMRVRMSEGSKLQLITTVRDFALHGTRCPLRDFQHIAGYLNWALNVYPSLSSPWTVCALCQNSWQAVPEGALMGQQGCGKRTDLDC